MVAAARHETDRPEAPPRRLRQPLAELKAELKRQRSLLSQLEQVAAAPKQTQSLARQIHGSLASTLPKQLQVQEVAFLPLLAAKAVPEDGLDGLIVQARTTISDLQTRVARVADDLGQLAAGGIMTHRASENLRWFCRQYRGYLSVALSILVPLAAVRFEERDLDSLAAAFGQAKDPSIPKL